MRSLATIPIIFALTTFTWKPTVNICFSFSLSMFIFTLSILSFHSFLFLIVLVSCLLLQPSVFFSWNSSLSNFFLLFNSSERQQFFAPPSTSPRPRRYIQHQLGLGQKSQERWVLIFPSLFHSRFFPPLIKVLLEYKIGQQEKMLRVEI